MTPVEALKIALGKEKDAVELYKKFSIEHPEIRELLTELLIQEEVHVKRIQKKISEITRI